MSLKPLMVGIELPPLAILELLARVMSPFCVIVSEIVGASGEQIFQGLNIQKTGQLNNHLAIPPCYLLKESYFR
jgi:hypothetical protein